MRGFGLDVHRDFCEVAIAERGRVRAAGRIATRVEALEIFAQSLVAGDVVALEATSGSAVSAELRRDPPLPVIRLPGPPTIRPSFLTSM